MLTDTSFLRNPHYHLPTDTPDTLDYPRMAEVTVGVVGAASHVWQGPSGLSLPSDGLDRACPRRRWSRRFSCDDSQDRESR